MKKRILLVDDEETLRWALYEALSEEGYEVDDTNDGIEALEMIKNTHYDLVISDLSMPTINGLQLVSEIKEIRPATKAVIITAYGSTEAVIEAMHLGVSDFITKPFKIEHIKNVILSAMSDAANSEGEICGEVEKGNDESDRQTENYSIERTLSDTLNYSFCDVVETGHFKVILFVCLPRDVDTKNIDVRVVSVFRYMAKIEKSSAVIVDGLNQYLCENIKNRYPVALFCAVFDKQKHTLSYSANGKALAGFLINSDREIKILNNSIYPLNMFPWIKYTESEVSALLNNKLILLHNDVFLEKMRDNKITTDEYLNKIIHKYSDNCGIMAKHIHQIISAKNQAVDGEKDEVVVVLNLMEKKDIFWEEKIFISVPLGSYAKTVDMLDQKLIPVVSDSFKRYEIVTSLNEAIMNAASFAYTNNRGEVLVKLLRLEQEILVEVSDYGCGFDAQPYNEVRDKECNDFIHKNGRGIFIMGKLMDRMMIQSSSASGTSVFMAKRVANNGN
ncbi:MAG: response regulator [Candidatus Brocadiaceae bacterium]|nr:response regulator [Candidatus Brocadiaceae bacterium]